MKFNLKKDIVFFDIESTGLNVLKDRIIQLALIKYFKNGRSPIEVEYLINPGLVQISKEAQAVHGISHDDLKNKPLFQQVAEKIYDFIDGCDLGGYNSDRFDIPMLMEEFARVGIDFSMHGRMSIDVQRLFYKMEPRTLKAAHKFYCGTGMENAHDALADVRATVNVLLGQIKKYENVDYEDADGNITPNPITNKLVDISNFTKDNKNVDVTNRFKYGNDGIIVFNFGKYIGKPVAELLYKDKQYLNWILEKDFSTQVKQIAKKLVNEYAKKINS